MEENPYQPGYRLENMMWMTLLVYDYIIPGDIIDKANYEKCKENVLAFFRTVKGCVGGKAERRIYCTRKP